MRKSRTTNAGEEKRATISVMDAARQLISFVAPYRARFALALLALGLGSGVNLLLPEIARRALDPAYFQTVLEHLNILTLGLALLFTVQAVAFYVRSHFFGVIGQRVYSDVRRKLFSHLISQGVTFYDEARSGDLTSRISSDAALVQEAVSVRFSVLLRYSLQVALGIVLMTWMSWRMTLAIVLSVVALVGVSALFIARLRRASRDYQTRLGQLVSYAGECFSGAKIVKALGARESATQGFETIDAHALAAAERRTKIAAAFSSGASLFLNILLLLVQWYGIHLVTTAELPLNDLAAFVLYGAIVAVSFSFLAGSYAELMQSLGGLERVFDILSEPLEETSSTAPLEDTQSGRGVDVRIEGVSFAYASRPDVQVLDAVSLHLEAGRKTALIGPSGSGKSTLVSLLLGFYSARAGTVALDGRLIQEIPEPQLRRLVSWVPQEPHLFGFSVYENLIFGNPGMGRREVEAKVAEWGFLDFISTLPDGLDTRLGEQGTQLSGGQRQRLAIARAILRRPSLLILDEATSGLDSETEAKVFAVLDEALPSTTMLIISHRLATVRSADAVYVLSLGRIVEQGTHEQLRNAAGIYEQYAIRQALG